MPQKFFITHSWDDIDFARRLCDDLRANGLDGFFDERSIRPGESIPKRIERGLEECDIYIPVFSPAALKSPWCDWEIDMAIMMNREHRGRPLIIPVIAEKCSLPRRLRHLLYVDFVNRYDDALNDLLTKGLGISPKPRALAPLSATTVSEVAETATPKNSVPILPKMPSFKLTTAAEIAGIIGTIIAYLALANQLGWLPFDAKGTPTPISSAGVSIPTVAPIAISTPASVLTPTSTNTLRPTATFTPKPTDTPRSASPTPSPIPTLGIGSTKLSPIDGATMVYVPAGEFTMGSTDQDIDVLLTTCKECKPEFHVGETPQHRVYLDAFWIDKFEVTNILYKKCVDMGKCSEPSGKKSHARGSYYGNVMYNEYPVIFVSWDDATKFCRWAGKQLPTEAQWEKSASWNDMKKEKRNYPWANTFDKTLTNSYEGGRGDTTAVGNYSDATSFYGAMDMSGNVWEWVADWFDAFYYKNSPFRNPMNEMAGRSRTIRGGAWNVNFGSVRTTTRDGNNPPTYKTDYIGFRCVE